MVLFIWFCRRQFAAGTKPEICFLPQRLGCALLSKERDGDSLGGRGSINSELSIESRPLFHWAIQSNHWALAARPTITAGPCYAYNACFCYRCILYNSCQWPRLGWFAGHRRWFAGHRSPLINIMIRFVEIRAWRCSSQWWCQINQSLPTLSARNVRNFCSDLLKRLGDRNIRVCESSFLSLNHFGHLPRNDIKLAETAITSLGKELILCSQPTFSDNMIELSLFFRSIQKTFGLCSAGLRLCGGP